MKKIIRNAKITEIDKFEQPLVQGPMHRDTSRSVTSPKTTWTVYFENEDDSYWATTDDFGVQGLHAGETGTATVNGHKLISFER